MQQIILEHKMDISTPLGFINELEDPSLSSEGVVSIKIEVQPFIMDDFTYLPLLLLDPSHMVNKKVDM